MAYATSEEAMEADAPLTVARADAELKRHYCRVVGVLRTESPPERRTPTGYADRICVTNDIDPAEWIDCTTRGVLEWLGY